MKIKNVILTGLAGVMLATANGFALPIVTFTDGPGTTGGGEFNAQTTAHGNFITFCLEASEHLAYGIPYYYEVSQSARYNGTTSTLDPLSKPTAWLYLQFLNGTLGTFGSSYTYIQDDGDANDLQRAFWYLEGETGGVNNYYAELAVSQAGSFTEDNNGFYEIGVMNLWANENGTGARQDQLIRLSENQSRGVPDSGSTFQFIGLAMGCLALVARRIRR